MEVFQWLPVWDNNTLCLRQVSKQSAIAKMHFHCICKFCLIGRSLGPVSWLLLLISISFIFNQLAWHNSVFHSWQATWMYLASKISHSPLVETVHDLGHCTAANSHNRSCSARPLLLCCSILRPLCLQYGYVYGHNSCCTTRKICKFPLPSVTFGYFHQ